MSTPRRLVHLMLPLVLAASAACSAEDDPNGGFPFDCQPLCKDANGNLLGAANDITVKAADSDEASAVCLQQVSGSAGVCPAGQTVERCSCDLSSGSGA